MLHAEYDELVKLLRVTGGILQLIHQFVKFIQLDRFSCPVADMDDTDRAAGSIFVADREADFVSPIPAPMKKNTQLESQLFRFRSHEASGRHRFERSDITHEVVEPRLSYFETTLGDDVGCN